MLNHLSISNVALIERAEVDFSGGLNVLSGETGAGKSVILDCIDFVLGAKADKSIVRYGAEYCLVRAEFSVEGNERVTAVLKEMDVETDDTLIISRKLTAEGKSSLKLNGMSVTVAMLRRVSHLLVDVHGQSEHFFLLKESNQLHLLDTIASPKEEKAELSALLAVRKSLLGELSLIGGDAGERARRADVLRFQIEELERAQLTEGEEEELTALRDRFRNAERILSGLVLARDYLSSEGGAADACSGAERALSSLIRYDARYAELTERLENAAAELADIADSVERYAGELDMDEAEAERVENRLDEIKTLKKKYGGSVSAALVFLEKAKEEFTLLSDSGERYERLTDEIARNQEAVYDACIRLSQARKRAAEGFTQRVTEELTTLNIASARFDIQFEPFTREDAAQASENGLDRVRFLFSANAGEPLKEMSKIISGGEMSRFMLAVKAQLSYKGEIGTYLFDEIDAGIGGKTARVVAEKFCKLAKNIQVIAVTHSAQIAAFADSELLIEKFEEGGKTYSSMRAVTGEDRRRELARLIGGEGEGFALLHADELLRAAAVYKNSL